MIPYSEALINEWNAGGHFAKLFKSPEYEPVDLAFFLSYGTIVGREVLSRADHNLVVHGSELPKGRGWSPWSWQILEGKNHLPLTLIEAAEEVDSGDIYDQCWVELRGDELIDEWRSYQAETTITLCREFVSTYPRGLENRRAQQGEETVYNRRRPDSSALDPHKSLAEQFNLLRIVDNKQYPAFFDLNGGRYILKIQKIKY